MTSGPSLNYVIAASPSFQALLAFGKRAAPSIDARLRGLVNARVSQVNGCAFGIDMHAEALLRTGLEQRVLNELAGWRAAPGLFSARDCAALAWAEAVNAIPARLPSARELRAMREQFSDSEIAEITFAVGAIRAFNMLDASFRTPLAEEPYVGE